MQRSTHVWTAVALLALVLLPGPAHADIFVDDFDRCLVNSTTKADQIVLAKHSFALMSLHPALRAISGMTDEERAAIRDASLALYTRLLIHDRRPQFIAAVKADGTDAVQSAFNLLGGVATRNLMLDPAVQAGLNEFGEAFKNSKPIDAANLERDINTSPP
jgi:hypothetical protein